jgi:hypothetical protein
VGNRDHGKSEAQGDGPAHGPIKGFIRSLVSGIPWSESADGEQVLNLPIPANKLLQVHNNNGRTSIIGEERDDIEVTATKQARAECPHAASELVGGMNILADEVNGVLEIGIEIPRKWNRYGRVALAIRMPNSVQTEVSSSNGKVNVCGMRANVQARSGNGSVSIRDVVGNLVVSAANAKVCCKHTNGKLSARSSNGNVELHDHSGAIDAMTSNGSIRASVTQIDQEGVTLSTSNGRIMLDLPETVDAEVDVRVDNGVIRNDRSEDPGITESAGRVRGKFGEGGPLIKLRTSNGTISIH